MKKRMHRDARGRIFGNAKALRKKMTFAEKLLWSRIRNNKIGYYFRRQHPMSNFVLDFYCEPLQQVIEVDGGIHAERIVQLEDKCKEEALISYGLKVIRFTNKDVLKSLDGVVNSIVVEAQKIEENMLMSP